MREQKHLKILARKVDRHESLLRELEPEDDTGNAKVLEVCYLISDL